MEGPGPVRGGGVSGSLRNRRGFASPRRLGEKSPGTGVTGIAELGAWPEAGVLWHASAKGSTRPLVPPGEASGTCPRPSGGAARLPPQSWCEPLRCRGEKALPRSHLFMSETSHRIAVSSACSSANGGTPYAPGVTRAQRGCWCRRGVALYSPRVSWQRCPSQNLASSVHWHGRKEEQQ